MCIPCWLPRSPAGFPPHQAIQYTMKTMISAAILISLTGCASSANKAQQEQVQKEQLQLAIKKIDIACRDKYPMGTPGAFMKRKQCQQVGIESMDMPKN